MPKPKKTLRQRIETRISRKKGDVFLREDFDDLGGYDQVGRELRALCTSGVLYRIGYGLYARAYMSKFSDRPLPQMGLLTLYEAIERLGVKILPTRAQVDYNEFRSTQVPTGRVVGIDRRLRRKIGYGSVILKYERVGGRKIALL